MQRPQLVDAVGERAEEAVRPERQPERPAGHDPGEVVRRPRRVDDPLHERGARDAGERRGERVVAGDRPLDESQRLAHDRLGAERGSRVEPRRQVRREEDEEECAEGGYFSHSKGLATGEV